MQQGKQNLQHTTQHNSIWIEQIMFIVDKTSNFKLQNEQTKKIGLLLLLMELVNVMEESIRTLYL